MRELGPAQIHLWQYPIDEAQAARHLADAMMLLSDAEKRRYAAFHMERDRVAYALSHAMVRLVLSEYAPVKPEDWQFLNGEKGKPEIAGPALDPPLWFNLSHTDLSHHDLSHSDGFAVCVVGRIRQLGVDVENVNRTVSCQELAQRFFAPSEYEYLRDLPLNLQREAFFRIWTLKEAYIKALGKGLSIPLDSFHFRFPAGNPTEIGFESNGEPTPDSWSFFEFQPGPDYRIAVGARNTGNVPFQVERLDAALLLTR